MGSPRALIVVGLCPAVCHVLLVHQILTIFIAELANSTTIPFGSPPLGFACNRRHTTFKAKWRTRRNRIIFALSYVLLNHKSC